MALDRTSYAVIILHDEKGGGMVNKGRGPDGTLRSKQLRFLLIPVSRKKGGTQKGRENRGFDKCFHKRV